VKDLFLSIVIDFNFDFFSDDFEGFKVELDAESVELMPPSTATLFS
jgi:hypothetical protein